MVGSFLGSALGVTVVGVLLSLWTAKKQEQFRAALAKAALDHSEELKAALAKAGLEHSVRFTKVYERRFEVAEEVWAALVKADRALTATGSPMWTGDQNLREDWKRFAVAADEFRETFNRLIIHFSDDAAGKFEVYWQAMKEAGFAAQDKADQEDRRGWYERYSKARGKMEELRPVLKRECQSLLTGLEPLKA